VIITRRDFLKAAAIAPFLRQIEAYGQSSRGVVVNDVHSQLTATRINRIVTPPNLDGVLTVVHQAQRESRSICIAGGRHAMGAQPFATDGVMVDIHKLDRVLSFDRERGLIEVESGIQWPALLAYLTISQKDAPQQWTFAQKQTGADRLTMGGCLSSNVHGRGLTLAPFIADVEAFRLINAQGELVNCSRKENEELFRLAIGGYGLFGLIYSVTLRLVPRRQVQRVVEVREVNGLMAAFGQRIRDGFLYGDFQYEIDEESEDFMRRGVFSCYRPVDPSTPISKAQKELSESDWVNLLYLAHVKKSEAFRQYADYYLSTNGQVYWSDAHQMSIYPHGYHRVLDRKVGARHRATEVITEIYVERDALPLFMKEVADDFGHNKVNVVYGTVRLIEQDKESFLAWARKSYACIVFNLHVVHTPEGLRHGADAFRRLIDLGLKYDGSYYPTYHKYATRQQVEACHPRFPEFLKLKRQYDRKKVFQSDWYRFYRNMFEVT